jgi:hypothetical protein
MANLKHVVTDLHQVYLTEMEAKIKPQIGSSASSSESGEKKSAAGGGGEDSIKKAARQLAYDTRYKARREGIPLERAFSQSSANSKASAPVKDAAKAMLFSGPKEEFEVDEATAMAKRGYDEAPIRQKIAKSTGGGEAADRASALEKKSTFGDAKKAKARQDLARKQRGDFRKTTSSSPGLHGYAHKSDDAGVKAKQAARGAQRSALTPAERKNLNMGDEVAQTGDNLQELKKGDKEMVRITPKKGYGKGYVRFADRKKQSELRKNPQIQSVTGTNYGEPYEGKYKTKPGEKNTVGDKDGDGTKEPNSHEYAGVKDKAIKNAMKKDAKKKEDIKASFSNWRAGLTESQLMEISGEEKNKKITEKSVNNTIVINPELKEAVASLGGEVVDVQELTQEQVTEILKDQITENLAYLEELGIDIQEISAQLALTASQKADNERRKAAVAGDNTRAAEKARQASALYKGVGPRRARERAQQVKK